MLFYIKYKNTFNENEFKMWLSHYKKLDLYFKIYVEYKDILDFNNKYYNSTNLIINYIPENVLELTEKDYLFSYTKDNNDNMKLSYIIDKNFINKSLCIGKIFYVPIEYKPEYTTFEIPDFILYQHKDHTNYTVDGIKINGGKNISDNLVCLNLNISKVVSNNNYYIHEYYQNNALKLLNYDNNELDKFDEFLGMNIYIQFNMNIIVNKEKKYGFIWYSKCGCSTLSNIFCKVNNINLDINKDNKKSSKFEEEDIMHDKRSLNFLTPLFRYNVYLQNIEFISFVRNPYHRFLSCFIDKHIDQVDNVFLIQEGYLRYMKIYKNDNLNNLLNYLLNNGFVTMHYKPFSQYDYIDKIKNVNVFKIEDNLNEKVFNFLSKYHNILDTSIKDCHDNINKHNKIKIENESQNINKNMLYCDKNEWLEYLSKNKLDYNKILENIDIRDSIYKIYKNDFIKFNYQKI